MDKLYAFTEGGNLKKKTPESVLLVKFGTNEFTRNNKKQAFDVTEEDADVIIKDFESRGKNLVFDFGHSSLSKDAGFKGDAPAAGWCDKLEKTVKGIVAHVSEWTPKGKERIESGEYSYHSPVLFFDNETHRPNAMHSVAITNIPAIHGSQKLVAASDFWNGDNDPMENEPTVTDKYKSLATQIVGNIRDAKSELDGIMVSLSDITGDDEGEVKNLQEFSDGLFKEDLEAFQEEVGDEVAIEEEAPEAFSDLQKEYDSILPTTSGENMLKWLDKKEAIINLKLQTASDNDKLDLMNDLAMVGTEKTRLEKFKTDNKEAWDKGLKAFEDTSKPVAFSDILLDTIKANNKVAFSDIDIKEEDIIKELKSLYEFKDSTILALSDLGADSTDTLKAVVEKVNDNALDVEARSYIFRCVADPECKITEAMQDWAVDFYKKDKDGFKKHYDNSPVAFSQKHPQTVQPEKHKAKCSESQKSLAELFGNDPEEVYKN